MGNYTWFNDDGITRFIMDQQLLNIISHLSGRKIIILLSQIKITKF